MNSQKKVAVLTAVMIVPMVLIALSMTLALAQQPELDVGVFKFDDPDPVVSGGDLTYTILVTNSQGVTATNVMVTDTLHSEVAYVSATEPCVENSPGVLSCTPSGGDLDPGEQISFTIDVQVSPYAYYSYSQISNTVEVSATAEGGGGDTNLGNNTAVEYTQLEGWADLTIWKEAFPGDVVPIGEWFSYTLWVENLGPSVSYGPVVMDWFATDGSLTAVWAHEYEYRGPLACGPMPTDQGWAETPAWLLNWVDAVCDLTGDPYFCDEIEPWWEAWWAYWYNSFPPNYPYPLAVDWMCIWYPWYFEPLDPLEPGEPFSVTIDVLPLDAQTIYNQAWVVPDMFPYNWFDEEWYGFDGWGTPDPDPYNNMDEIITEVTNEADLKVVKVSKPDTNVDAGQPFTYTIFVENVGPAPAHNVSIRDEILSSGVFTVVNTILDPDRADDGPFYPGSPEGGLTMEFHLEEPLEPKGPDNQGRWVIQIVLRANETQDVNNLVQVFTREGGSFDPDLSNNEDEDSIYVGDVADLELTKSIAPPPGPPFYAGGTPPMRFRLQVTNHGPSTAENVVVEDMLPQGVTVVNFDPGPGSCTTGTPGSTPLRCDLGTLAVDDVATVFVSVRIDPDYLGTLENDAWVYSDIFDPNNSNDRDSVIVQVQTQANLTLDKDAPPPYPWRAGEIRTYRYNINNSGPSVSRDVRLRDFLPAQVEFVSAYAFKEGSTGGIPLPCNVSAANVLICPLGDIPPTDPPGVVVLVDVYIKPDVPDGTTIWNDADLITDTSDPGGAEDSVGVQISNEADLSVRKEADPWKVYAGEQIRYDIEVTNNGPGVADDVFVTDTLPISVTYEIDTDDCDLVLSDPQDVLSCTLGTIPPGQTRNFSIFARVDPGAELGTVRNRADVYSETTNDPIDYNDWNTAPNYIQGKADLKVTKFGKPDGEVRAGEELIYTVIVDNLGTGYAHDVVLRDVLESNGTFALQSVTSDRPALCTTDPPATLPSDFEQDVEITCALTNTLEVMTPEASGRWVVTVVAEAAEPQSINNVVHVVSSDFDPDLSNNQAIAEHDITAVADLELDKVAWGEVLVGCEGETELWVDEVAAGGTVTYTLTVTNTGPSTAENVVVHDQPLPSLLEIDLQSITPSQGNCLTANIGPPDYLLTCNLGTLGPDLTATVEFTATVPPWVPEGTLLVNDALAYSDMFDNDTGNSIVSNHTVVSTWADLEVEKTQEPETALPGLEVTYSITVTNLGPSDAYGVMISDTLPFTPTTMTMECCASDGADCDVECEVPTCPQGECPWPEVDFIAQADIPAGEWVIYTLTATPEWVPCEMITNTVEVVAPDSVVYQGDIDPCDDNNLAYSVSDPECNFVPLVLKNYPAPDTTP